MIRPFANKDLEALRKMHETEGLPYEFPSKFFGLVSDSGNGPEQALLFRPTAEMYLLQDFSLSPAERWERFQSLHEAMRQFASDLGLSDVHCWLEPSVEKRFGKRLLALGWEPAQWKSWVFDLKGGA